MRQVWITKTGAPEVLALREAADPQPPPGTLRIRVAAAGVNFADIMGRMGLYPDLPPVPVVPGYEVAGRVDVVGDGVDPVWIGREVFALTRFGGYADLVCVPLAQVFARPEGMSVLDAAAFGVNYLTAWQLVVVMGGLNAHETMLVHSAGGGVGIAATQIAKHIGARVIGTASGVKHDKLRVLGADHLIDYRREDFEARVKDITGGRGVELILDAVGGASLRKDFRLLAPTGRLGMFGISAAAKGKTRGVVAMAATIAGMPWLQSNPIGLINANKGLFGVNVGRLWDEGVRVRGWADELLALWRRGALKPQIARIFPFDEAVAAHHYIQDRKNVGKVLLVP